MKKTTYVDGYLVVVNKKDIDAYTAMAKEAAEVWLRHGALSVKECMGDDMTPSLGGMELLQFHKLMNISEDETVWYSYIEYESKTERDRVNALVNKEMKEYHEQHPNHLDDMPFDVKKMAFGGFEVKVG